MRILSIRPIHPAGLRRSDRAIGGPVFLAILVIETFVVIFGVGPIDDRSPVAGYLLRIVPFFVLLLLLFVRGMRKRRTNSPDS
jgi:hypothetical protein